MEYTKCSICGKKMKASLIPETDKPYKLQICGDACFVNAWREVTGALKKGVRPNYNRARSEKRPLTENEKDSIILLNKQGIRQADIARKLDRSASSINRFLKKYKAL